MPEALAVIAAGAPVMIAGGWLHSILCRRSPPEIEPQPPAKAGGRLTPYRSFNNGSRNWAV